MSAWARPARVAGGASAPCMGAWALPARPKPPQTLSALIWALSVASCPDLTLRQASMAMCRAIGRQRNQRAEHPLETLSALSSTRTHLCSTFPSAVLRCAVRRRRRARLHDRALRGAPALDRHQLQEQRRPRAGDVRQHRHGLLLHGGAGQRRRGDVSEPAAGTRLPSPPPAPIAPTACSCIPTLVDAAPACCMLTLVGTGWPLRRSCFSRRRFPRFGSIPANSGLGMCG